MCQRFTEGHICLNLKSTFNLTVFQPSFEGRNNKSKEISMIFWNSQKRQNMNLNFRPSLISFFALLVLLLTQWSLSHDYSSVFRAPRKLYRPRGQDLILYSPSSICPKAQEVSWMSLDMNGKFLWMKLLPGLARTSATAMILSNSHEMLGIYGSILTILGAKWHQPLTKEWV